MDKLLLTKLLLTPAEAAKLLGLQTETLTRWRTDRRYPLAYVKVGGRVRYRRSDIDAFLDARTVSGMGARKTRKRRRAR